MKVFADYFLVSNTCGSGATSQQHAALAAVMSQLNKAQNKEWTMKLNCIILASLLAKISCTLNASVINQFFAA